AAGEPPAPPADAAGADPRRPPPGPRGRALRPGVAAGGGRDRLSPPDPPRVGVVVPAGRRDGALSRPRRPGRAPRGEHQLHRRRLPRDLGALVAAPRARRRPDDGLRAPADPDPPAAGDERARAQGRPGALGAAGAPPAADLPGAADLARV